jgi:hypothetical protein
MTAYRCTDAGRIICGLTLEDLEYLRGASVHLVRSSARKLVDTVFQIQYSDSDDDEDEEDDDDDEEEEEEKNSADEETEEEEENSAHEETEEEEEKDEAIPLMMAKSRPSSSRQELHEELRRRIVKVN